MSMAKANQERALLGDGGRVDVAAVAFVVTATVACRDEAEERACAGGRAERRAATFTKEG